MWKSCCQVFDYLNLAAVSLDLTPGSAKLVLTDASLVLVLFQIVDGKVLCVHGGLSPDVRTLDQIRIIARAQEIPHEGAFCGKQSRFLRSPSTRVCALTALTSSLFYRPDVVRSRRHRKLEHQPTRSRMALWKCSDARSKSQSSHTFVRFANETRQASSITSIR